MFDPNSRYFDPKTPDATLTLQGGRKIPYRPLRTLPQQSTITIQTEVESRINERPDQLAARTIGDPELAWQLFDANLVFDPLTVPIRWSSRWKIPGA